MSADSERLIARLAAELEPRRPLPRLRWVGAGVLAIAAAMTALLLLAGGFRADVLALDVHLRWVVLLGTLLVLASGGLATALAAAIPGRERLARAAAAASIGTSAVLAGGATALLVSELDVGPSATWASQGLLCLAQAWLVAALPGAALGAFVLRAAPRRPLAALGAGALGAAGLGAVAVHLSCGATDLEHMAAIHALAAPFVGASTLWLLLVALRPRLAANPGPPAAPVA